MSNDTFRPSSSSRKPPGGDVGAVGEGVGAVSFGDGARNITLCESRVAVMITPSETKPSGNRTCNGGVRGCTRGRRRRTGCGWKRSSAAQTVTMPVSKNCGTMRTSRLVTAAPKVPRSPTRKATGHGGSSDRAGDVFRAPPDPPLCPPLSRHFRNMLEAGGKRARQGPIRSLCGPPCAEFVWHSGLLADQHRRTRVRYGVESSGEVVACSPRRHLRSCPGHSTVTPFAMRRSVTGPGRRGGVHRA
ncbi:hypothetical protein FHX78_111544 [Streptomyces capillispiralis]|uniref:Uncharacterized protein n=1 Tax=Streptomyces capillispiralis TaxID=68182 RepID=A0A561TBX8_9ACTN|nr:hypothetical protein FHX78_111544 [Streptomyces capillispiralis]